jgi:hypothetical protein
MKTCHKIMLCIYCLSCSVQMMWPGSLSTVLVPVYHAVQGYISEDSKSEAL